MWQRFTEMARRVVFHAQQEAQALGCTQLGSDLLLLGLLREEDCVACRVLNDAGIDREKVEKLVRKGLGRPKKLSDPNFTLAAEAKKSINRAYDEARRLNNNYIGTEHVLLGILAGGKGAGAKALVESGADLEVLRGIVVNLQEGASTPTQTPVSELDRAGKILDAYHRNQARLRAEVLGGTEKSPYIREAILRASAAGREFASTPDLVLAIPDDPNSRGAKAIAAVRIDAGELKRAAQSLLIPSLGEPSERLAKRSTDLRLALVKAIENAETMHEPLDSGHLVLGMMRDAWSASSLLLDGRGVVYEHLWLAVAQLEGDTNRLDDLTTDD